MTTRRTLRGFAASVGTAVLGADRYHEIKSDLLARGQYRTLCAMREKHTVEVRQPLVLISQVQRSGGTLLAQLFDGHPECHAHPHELYIGHPDKYTWPRIDLADGPEVWFERLQERPAWRSFRRGYKKYTKKFLGAHDTLPFLFLPQLQRQIFTRTVREHAPTNSRDVLDAYMTSYFNAWLDNHNLYARPKKLITGFVPVMSDADANVDQFFAAYPDGFLISIIRDPRGWYASAKGHDEARFGTLDSAMTAWTASADAMRRAHARHGARVYLLTFEDLVTRTEPTMRALAAALGISWSPTLLNPTFNTMPIKADSSYAINEFGVVKEAASRFEAALTPAEIASVEASAMDLYERVRALTLGAGR